MARVSAVEEVDEVDRYVGRRIARLRAELALSEAAMAALLDLSPEEVRAIEQGDAKVYASMLHALSKALNASVSDILPPLPN